MKMLKDTINNILYQTANDYCNFTIAGKIFPVPYAIAREATQKYDIGHIEHKSLAGRFANYAGKGTPAQIKQSLLKTAEKEQFDLHTATAEEIVVFMQQHGIGIECSGFVYNVLNGYLKKERNKNLDTLILRYPGILGNIERFLLQKNRVRRCNAATLTNDVNTVKIEKVTDIQPGDMLRLTHSDWAGKHIAIIVDITDTYIIYAMASEYSNIQGAHFAKIKILDKHKGLEQQQWEEVTTYGKNYGKDAFDPKRGDSVRRLKYLGNIV